VSVARVLAAAAALREFSTAEIAAYSDEPPAAVEDILDATGGAVQRVGPPPEDPAVTARWRVAEAVALRRQLQERSEEPHRKVTPDVGDDAVDQLRHAEQVLLRCGAEDSGERRRVLVSTAVNHLRQATAAILRSDTPWWAIELGSGRFDDALRRHPDRATGTRLRLGVTVARLAVDHVTGNPAPGDAVAETVADLRHDAAQIGGGDWLDGLVRGLVDVATAQVAPADGPAVHKLVVAVARRRVAVQAGTDPDAAMTALELLVRRLGGETGPARVSDLYRTLRRLPEGDHALVYTDLLALLPREVHCDRFDEPLPGGLVEVVGDHAAAERLSRCAAALECDLRTGNIHSDAGLIGQAAQVFQFLTEEAPVDDTVRSSGDATRSELNTLARARMWPLRPVSGEGAP
jgi:hypothetical protein